MDFDKYLMSLKYNILFQSRLICIAHVFCVIEIFTFWNPIELGLTYIELITLPCKRQNKRKWAMQSSPSFRMLDFDAKNNLAMLPLLSNFLSKENGRADFAVQWSLNDVKVSELFWQLFWYACISFCCSLRDFWNYF